MWSLWIVRVVWLGVAVRFPHGETVTVLKEQRDPSTGVSALVADRALAGCAVEWFRREPVDQSREWQQSRGYLYTQPGSGLVAGERIRFADGTVWEVVVDADVWRSPFTGWTAGDRAALRRVTPPV